jgi:paraquat-inducible protein B
MSTPTNHWKLGLFVIIGFVMMLSTLAWLGARSMRKEVGRYVSYFDESVQGLEVGSPIKFRGVTIGSVAKIDIAEDHRHVEVTSELGKAELTRLGLDEVVGPVEAGKPLKFEQGLGLRVQLASSGLTGLKFLQLDFFAVENNPEPVLPFKVPDNHIPAITSTLKNIEDPLVRVAQRLPEVVDQMERILSKVDSILGDLKDKNVPERIITVLDNANLVLGEAEKKIAALDTDKLSKDASKTINELNRTVAQLNALLSGVGGDKGLLASVTRASDALGDTVRGADGIGGQLEDTLGAVEKAAKSIQKLATALERDPDMLLKGKGRGVEGNR